jgi:CDP-glucose 4,6-dehydratase
MQLDKKFWNKKKVFVTGHTGFKGGWLLSILNYLGSEVSGYALNPQGKNNFFNSTKIKEVLTHDIRKNIINLDDLKSSIKKIKPEIVFHLAAQSSVIESFKESNKTVLTNIVGTSNILEALRNVSSVKCLIIVTTDKVYQNYKLKKYFDENSILGGDDVYSGSKACFEILTNSYRKSFFTKNDCRIATVRAGNCFGGGDWTKDRIVKDALESFYDNKILYVRNPEATRPWQHVIEPLTGYLLLAEKLFSSNGYNYCGAWNFGPSLRQNMKVLDLAKIIKSNLNSKSKIVFKKKDNRFNNKKYKIFESKYLNINSKKAYKKLKWRPELTIKNAVNLTIDWYKHFRNKKDLFDLTNRQVKQYLNLK